MRKLLALLIIAPIIGYSQLKISGTCINKREFVEDVVMSIQDTSGSFYAEFILGRSEFSTKLSLNNFYIVTFTKEGYVQRKVYVNTHEAIKIKYSFKFDVEMFLISEDNKLITSLTPVIYYEKNGDYFNYKY